MKANTLLTTLVTVISILTGVISIYMFVTGKSHLEQPGFQGDEYFHSPWLGIEIYQGDHKVEMQSERSYEDAIIKAKMDARPFMLRIPKQSEDDAVQICVWTDDSIFARVQADLATEQIPFFSPGTGIAGARFSIPLLYIANEAHNYFRYERLEKFSDSKHGISISKFDAAGTEYHVSEQDGPLYMIVLMDLNQNDVVEHQEWEKFVLDF